MPSSVAVIGVNFSKYAPTVFETKYVYGENGNPLSPAFPEGGKWFNRYDTKKHILYIACPECAAAKKAMQCKHPRSSIVLFSDTEGPAVLQGGQYAQIQFDEQIDYAFLGEALKRLETVPNSGLVVTETPLNGKGWWTNTVLARDAAAGKKIEGTGQPLVSLHTIDQFEAGLTPHHIIKADMELMSPAEIEARVYGRPAAFNEMGVFDTWEISAMLEEAVDPVRGEIYFEQERAATGSLPSATLMHALKPSMPMLFDEKADGSLRLWKRPEPGRQYVIGGDVAQGLTHRDPSCASVLELSLSNHDVCFELVAQLHGWMNPRLYAEDLIKLAIWYNEALVVIERNGPGAEAIRSMVEWGYWNLFQDISDPAQSQFGMDPLYGINTDRASKPVMVASLQQTVKDKRSGRRMITIPCRDTLDEMGSFGQVVTPSGKSITFQGAPGMADDRVISLMVPVYAAKVFGVYDVAADARAAQKKAMEALAPHERAIWDDIRRRDSEMAQEASRAWY
jgi:hypothetical protein